MLSVTGICPTYGRFERLRDSIACFILQDYPGPKCLSILNDAPVPLCLSAVNPEEIRFDEITITLRNVLERFPSFGQKKQALVGAARTDIVAHWDDDDLILPWHLSILIGILEANPGIECVKPCYAWMGKGDRNKVVLYKRLRKRYDGQMVFRRGTSAEYAHTMRQTAMPLLENYYERETIIRPGDDDNPDIAKLSYVFRRVDEVRHLSRSGSEIRVYDGFARGNKDFGDGRPLLPNHEFRRWARDRMWIQFIQIIRGWERLFRKYGETRDSLIKRLLEVLRA